MTRVLHLLWEPARSGISQHVLELVRILPDLRHAVVLPAGLAGVAEELRGLGAEPHELPMRSRLLPRSALRAIPAVIRGLDPDVVHLHALETGLFGTLAAALGGARAIVFQPQTVEIRQRRLLPLLRRLLRLAGRRHAAWIGVSRGQLAGLEALVPRGRVSWIPNPVPSLAPAPPRAEARARLGWPGDAFVVVSVARLAAQKDPLTFARAARRNPGLLHVLVGDGPLRAEVEACARGAPQLRLQGQVRGLSDVLAGADVLCLASRWEGLSLTLLEALARGVPAVASAIDGNTDAVLHERTGLLVPPGDPAALARAIARLHADPALRARLALAGQAHVAETFSGPVVAAQLRALYAEVSAERPVEAPRGPG